MKSRLFCFILIGLFFLVSCGKEEESKVPGEVEVIRDTLSVVDVKAQIEKLAPVQIAYDASQLSKNEKQALDLMVKAAQYMDRIFLEQVYINNESILMELKNKAKPEYEVLLEYFLINFGPFDRLEKDRPFINLADAKPKGANFYPADISREEFNSWLQDHPRDEESFTSNFTLIQREKSKLVAVPYSTAYRKSLEPASKLLKEAARKIDNPSLRKYLNSRAEAFLTNDYYQSDMDWMDLKDHNIEIVIGPYEVYEDGLFGYKAAFECFITIVDRQESEKLNVIEQYLDEMERHLPIDDKYKNFDRGKSSPVIVANEVFAAGDTKAGIQTTAFNLPNDERVRQQKGSKKVMLKNVARAKFEKCWIPISQKILAKSDLPYISFDSYYNHVLMHEVAHGLGPGIIEKEGKKTTVNKELKELYSTIEEAKADIVGLWNLDFMIAKGVFPKELKDKMYVSYLGGIFRSVRFGTDSAHGGGNVIQLNYLMERGGFRFDEESIRFSVNHERIQNAVKELAHDLLMIQALGDYNKAKEFIGKYRHVSPQLERVLEAVADVPIDIKPVYAILK